MVRPKSRPAGPLRHREGMCGVEDEDDFVFSHALAFQFAAHGGAFDDAEGEGLLDHGGNDVLGVTAYERETDVRVLAEEGSEDARQQVLGDGGGRAEAELAGDVRD